MADEHSRNSKPRASGLFKFSVRRGKSAVQIYLGLAGRRS